jgi:hypothetical protein
MQQASPTRTLSGFTVIQKWYFPTNFFTSGVQRIGTLWADSSLTEGLYLQAHSDDGITASFRWFKDNGAVSTPEISLTEWHTAYSGREVWIAAVFDNGLGTLYVDGETSLGSLPGSTVDLGVYSNLAYIGGYGNVASRYVSAGTRLYTTLTIDRALSATEIYLVSKLDKFSNENFSSSATDAIVDSGYVSELPNTADYSTLGSFTQSNVANRFLYNAGGYLESWDGKQWLAAPSELRQITSFFGIFKIYLTSETLNINASTAIFNDYSTEPQNGITVRILKNASGYGIFFYVAWAGNTRLVQTPYLTGIEFEEKYLNKILIISVSYAIGYMSLTINNEIVDTKYDVSIPSILLGDRGYAEIGIGLGYSNMLVPSGTRYYYINYGSSFLSATEIYNITKDL